MAHITTLNRFVYLSVCFSLSALLYIPISIADDSASGQSVSSTLQVNSTTGSLNTEKEIDPNKLSVKQIFDSINFDSETSTTTESSLSNTTLDGNENLVGQSIGNMLISLAFVILIGLMIAWFMRRYVVRDSNLGGGKINLLASYALSQKSKVYLLRIGSQTFLVGEGNNELNLISEVNSLQQTIEQEEPYELSGTDELPSNDVQQGGFESKLNQWTSALQSKDMKSEVNTSLLLLGGLAQRLRNKREG